MELLPVALQVGDAGEGGAAVLAREPRPPGPVQPQPVILVLGQRAERQPAFCATFCT